MERLKFPPCRKFAFLSNLRQGCIFPFPVLREFLAWGLAAQVRCFCRYGRINSIRWKDGGSTPAIPNNRAPSLPMMLNHIFIHHKGSVQDGFHGTLLRR